MSTASLYSFLMRRIEEEVSPREERVRLPLLFDLALFFFPAISALVSPTLLTRFLTEDEFVSDFTAVIFVALPSISAMTDFGGGVVWGGRLLVEDASITITIAKFTDRNTNNKSRIVAFIVNLVRGITERVL